MPKIPRINSGRPQAQILPRSRVESVRSMNIGMSSPNTVSIACFLARTSGAAAVLARMPVSSHAVRSSRMFQRCLVVILGRF